MHQKNNYLLISALITLVFLINSTEAHNTSKAESTMRNTESETKFITEINGIKEFKLSNGLKILLKLNHSIPLVTFSIWYKVGSRNEEKGHYGLAHFLEHMMFKGTKNYKKGEISETIQSRGGVFNAFTANDGTAYYETISPKYLEEVIKIESDRIKGSLLNEDELSLEKTVVLSELQGDLNNPAVLLDQKVRFLAYEVNPYKHPTIGYEDDIKSINSKIMRKFYQRFYNPDNATVILVGDFNEDTALKLIKKYFGNIKNEEHDIAAIPRDPEQTKEKRVIVKRSGSFKIVEVAYHIPDVRDKDIYPLNIVEEILIKGKKSPFNKKLIETGLVTEISGGAEANTDPGLFYILASLTPKATHKQVEKIILNEINKLIKNPPSVDEINAAKNRIKANYLFNLDGTYSQAFNLGYFELTNIWKQALDWPDEITKVSQEDVSKVLKKYFQKENRTVGYFIPKIRKGEKYEPQSLSVSRTQHYTKNTKIKDPNLTSKYTTYSSNKYKYKKIQLQEGSDLLIYKNIDLPISYISGVIKGGSSLIPKEKEWTCQIITRALEKGSKNYTKEQIESVLDSTGSQIDFSCDEESFKFNITSLNENLKETINLFTDILINPSFPQEEIRNEKEKLIAEIIESKDYSQEVSRRRFNQIIYPKGHPYYSNNFDEDIKYIKQIKKQDLIEAHETIVKKNKSIISLISNLEDTQLKSITDNLQEKLNIDGIKQEGQVNIPSTPIRETPKEESISVKEKLQSDVFLGHAGNLKRTDPDFYKIHIANYILGGSSLTSHLAKKVRDNAGLVYVIYSYINASHGKGEFGIYFGSDNKNVDKAIELTKELVANYVKNGITNEDLKKAKASLVDSFVSRNLSTYKGIGNTLTGIEFYNLGSNYIEKYPQIINSITLNDVNNTIKKYIFPKKINIVVAGDYKKK